MDELFLNNFSNVYGRNRLSIKTRYIWCIFSFHFFPLQQTFTAVIARIIPPPLGSCFLLASQMVEIIEIKRLSCSYSGHVLWKELALDNTLLFFFQSNLRGFLFFLKSKCWGQNSIFITDTGCVSLVWELNGLSNKILTLDTLTHLVLGFLTWKDGLGKIFNVVKQRICAFCR